VYCNYKSVCAYVCMYVCLRACMCDSGYIGCMYVNIMGARVFDCGGLCVYVCVCMCVCVCVCVCVCTGWRGWEGETILSRSDSIC